jgi:Tellurite resistance protein TerB
MRNRPRYIVVQVALNDHSTRRLLEEAIVINCNAIDLYRFTRQLNEILDDDGRSQLVQMMWELVYADGSRTILTRISFGEWLILLGVSSRWRVELRQKVSLERALSQARDVLPHHWRWPAEVSESPRRCESVVWRVEVMILAECSTDAAASKICTLRIFRD